MEAGGVSEKATNHITNVRWAGTQARYESVWDKRVTWRTQRQTDSFK